MLAAVHLLRGAVSGAGGDREAVLEVAQLAVLDAQVVESPSSPRTGSTMRGCGPVDVEPVRVGAVPAVVQHVPPGRVGLRHGNAHVVGHDVDDQAEPVRAQRLDQPQPRLLAAQLGVDRPVVDDVVAVLGAGRGGQQRRRVEVADPEIRAGRRRARRSRRGRTTGSPGRGRSTPVSRAGSYRSLLVASLRAFTGRLPSAPRTNFVGALEAPRQSRRPTALREAQTVLSSTISERSGTRIWPVAATVVASRPETVAVAVTSSHFSP